MSVYLKGELVPIGGSRIINLTKEEYEANKAEYDATDDIYVIDDGITLSAEDVGYEDGNVADALGSVDDALTWKVALLNISDTEQHNLPNQYRELSIVIATGIGRRLVINITRGMLQSSSAIFETGYYVNGENNANVGMNIAISRIGMNFAFENNANMSSFLYTVFYR